MHVAYVKMLFKKNKALSIRRVVEMDLGNFGGHEVFIALEFKQTIKRPKLHVDRLS